MRLGALLAVMGVAFAAIGVRLVDVQAVGATRYAQLGLDQRVQTVALAAERGSIFDRKGADLALSVPARSVVADPRVIPDPLGYAASLAPILGVEEKSLRAQLAQHGRAFVYLARKVDDATTTRVRALHLTGVSFVEESKRYYPADGLAAPVLGFVGTDNNGLGGLEYGHERALAGKPGQVVLERDPRGRDIPDGRRRGLAAQRGQDLVLTLDQSLQYEAEQALVDGVTRAQAKGGTAAIADVRTGDVLAMATVDGPTPDAPARAATGAEGNRPVTDVYEPGSTNKVITIASALEHGLVAPDTTMRVEDRIPVGDKVFADDEQHPPQEMSVTDIVSRSSNVGTIMIAQQLGRDRLDAGLRAFGFGAKTAIDFPGEAPGLLIPPAQYSGTSMGTVPTGNGLAVTAMQMLDVYTTLANDGVSRPPRLVAATVDASGERHSARRQAGHRVVSSATAAVLRTMLARVVTEGTGTKARVPGYDVAGKTGTARKAPYVEGRYVASFVGFAPAEAPRLAAIVVVDAPGSGEIYGGQIAAPIFSRIMQYALRLERVRPSQVITPAEAAAQAAAASPVAPATNAGSANGGSTNGAVGGAAGTLGGSTSPSG